MNAEALLVDLRRRGLRLDAAGDRLIVAPASSLTDTDRAGIRLHKTALVLLLASDQEWFKERAGILQHDAGMTRAEAEAEAGELLDRMRGTPA